MLNNHKRQCSSAREGTCLRMSCMNKDKIKALRQYKNALQGAPAQLTDSCEYDTDFTHTTPFLCDCSAPANKRSAIRSAISAISSAIRDTSHIS